MSEQLVFDFAQAKKPYEQFSYAEAGSYILLRHLQSGRYEVVPKERYLKETELGAFLPKDSVVVSGIIVPKDSHKYTPLICARCGILFFKESRIYRARKQQHDRFYHNSSCAMKSVGRGHRESNG